MTTQRLAPLPTKPAPAVRGKPPLGKQADRLVSVAGPLLRRNKSAVLADWLRKNLSPRELCLFLGHERSDVRQVAAFSLAAVGCRRCVDRLVPLLRDQDAGVRQMAEHGLCGIWCRLGSPTGNEWLRRGSHCLGQGDIQKAVRCFDAAIAESPAFADAYNQRGLAHFLQNRPDLALLDGETCLRLEPNHFVAWAAVGHAHASLGDSAAAAECYRHALDIHPGMHAVQEMLREVEAAEDRC
ncbi:MAG: tetratricopeptide repeat protein [Planctomycetota bacterium]